MPRKAQLKIGEKPPHTLGNRLSHESAACATFQHRSALCWSWGPPCSPFTHAFGSVFLQRIDFASLSLTSAALLGVCYATKTTSQGQPFAVTIAGITGRDTSPCWPLHWLAALHRACEPFRVTEALKETQTSFGFILQWSSHLFMNSLLHLTAPQCFACAGRPRSLGRPLPRACPPGSAATYIA